MRRRQDNCGKCGSPIVQSGKTRRCLACNKTYHAMKRKRLGFRLRAVPVLGARERLGAFLTRHTRYALTVIYEDLLGAKEAA